MCEKREEGGGGGVTEVLVSMRDVLVVVEAVVIET